MTTTLHGFEPVARFRELCTHLRSTSAGARDLTWLRFAAAATVLRPEAPAETAHAIDSMVASLSAQVGWFDSIKTPLGIAIAANLVQTGDTAPAFLDDVQGSRRLFHDVHLPRRGEVLLKTVLITRILSGGKPMTSANAERINAIYERMDQHHPWLTDRDDIPACALLSSCAGSPHEIADRAERVHHELRLADLWNGQHLQTAANIVPLGDLEPTLAAERFLALQRAFALRWNDISADDYTAIALLSLLDHEPTRVVTWLRGIFDQLEQLPVLIKESVNVVLAAELTFLDLVRFDRQMNPVETGEALERVLGRIRQERAASVLLLVVPTEVEMLVWGP